MHFRRIERQLFITRFKLVAYRFFAPMAAISIVFDLAFQRFESPAYAALRTVIYVLTLSLPFLYHSRWVRLRAFSLPMHLFTLLISAELIAIPVGSAFELTSFSFRISIVATLSFCFMPWRLPGLLLSGLCIYGPLGFLALNSEGLISPQILFPSLGTAFTVGIMGMMINQAQSKELHQNISKKRKLRGEIRSRSRIIDQKNEQGLNLDRVTSQFSPQVLRAIKEGHINLETRVRRRITAIFVDIENSSSQSLKLDARDYEKVMEEFFSLCINIFLKHNVTIGTYLGDGMVGFVNAPAEEADHEIVATRASLELLAELHKRRASLNEKWRADFNIRIGIHCGFASIGFFPSPKFGTYTALGDSVNLAARLCSTAEANTICVSKNVLKMIAPRLRDIRAVEHGNVKNLKGFQTETLEIFTVRSSLGQRESSKNDCPTCTTRLKISMDLETCLLMKCPACGSTHIRQKDPSTAAS